MVIIGIKTHFDAAHYLPNYPGKCKEMHGHTWTVWVEVEGEIDERTQMVLDFIELKKLINDCIGKYDHHILNDLLPSIITEEGIFSCIPTCEALAKQIKKDLQKFSTLTINSIKVQEGDGGWAVV